MNNFKPHGRRIWQCSLCEHPLFEDPEGWLVCDICEREYARVTEYRAEEMDDGPTLGDFREAARTGKAIELDAELSDAFQQLIDFATGRRPFETEWPEE